jgi:hypothetical protein
VLDEDDEEDLRVRIKPEDGVKGESDDNVTIKKEYNAEEKEKRREEKRRRKQERRETKAKGEKG